MVIASAGIRSRLASRAFLGLLLVAWLPFLARVIQIYAAANVPQAAFLAPTPGMFRDFLDQQGVFLFFITVYAGAGLIANDRRANALQIYLSKPLTRWEYVVGKLSILAVFLLFVTWVPATLLLVVQILLAGNFTFLTGNLYLFPAITLFSFVEALTVAVVMLAFSSMSSSSRYVGILYAALLFFSEALFGVLRLSTGSNALSWLSVPFDLNQVGYAVFRLPPRYNVSLWPSLFVIVLLITGAAVVLQRRVRGVEVVA